MRLYQKQNFSSRRAERTKHRCDVERNAQRDVERLEAEGLDEKDVADAESQHSVEEKFTPDKQPVAQTGKEEAD